MTIHEFRILEVRLEDVEPVVRRKVIVDASLSLLDLHLVVVNAMGWGDSHLHIFKVGDDTYSAPVPQIDPMGIDERTISVGKALPKMASRIEWLYDMGDSWTHSVEVVGTGTSDSPTPTTLLDGSRACPPDDFGGTYAYMDLLGILDDPAYEPLVLDREDVLEWLDPKFNPARFDKAKAQRRIDRPPSKKQWDEIYATYPDVGEHWTREAMEEQRRQLDQFLASIGKAEPDTRAEGSETVHRLKITLRGIKPPIWRRIEVPSDITLGELAPVLEAAMGWMGGHLHMFDIDGVTYGTPDPDWGSDDLDENEFRLRTMLPFIGTKMRFDYDFGDGWQHNVVLEDINPVKADVLYPRCLTGRRACPPDDCGGPGGYADILAAVADPNNAELADLRDFVPLDYDPEYFDLDETDIDMRSPRPLEGW